jgi:molybdopterin-guanine dinucleotide biosynthesis protein A
MCTGSDTQQPPASGAVFGIVIAGGRSIRFGGEKAVALLRGTPLLLWAVRRLQRSCSAVAVNARPETEAETLAPAEGLTVLHDEDGDASGPLAGVKVGLRWAQRFGASSLAVSPCDVPLMPEALFDALIKAAGAGAAMAETAEGDQPLCSLWPASSLPAVTAALAGGRHPATWRLLEQLGAKRVRFEPPEAFANINTRSELATLSGRLAVEAAERVRGQ